MNGKSEHCSDWCLCPQIQRIPNMITWCCQEGAIIPWRRSPPEELMPSSRRAKEGNGPSATWGHSLEKRLRARKCSPDTVLASIVTTDFPASKTRRKQFLLFTNTPFTVFCYCNLNKLRERSYIKKSTTFSYTEEVLLFKSRHPLAWEE